jgi:hypothetical protein
MARPLVGKLKSEVWHKAACDNVSGLLVKRSVLLAMMGIRAPSSS